MTNDELVIISADKGILSGKMAGVVIFRNGHARTFVGTAVQVLTVIEKCNMDSYTFDSPGYPCSKWYE